MSTRNIVPALSLCLLFLAFLVIGMSVYSVPALPFGMINIGNFNFALWNFRKLDVIVQVMLIFTAAMGILVFFAEKNEK
jgi:hypothetical protein